MRPHAQFKRDDDDILLEVPITLDEAVLGAKIEVPTISGRVQLTVPKGTSSGRVFRLKGKGVKSAGRPEAGDQLVTVRIVHARHDRRQPRLLLLRVAAEAPLRSRQEVAFGQSFGRLGLLCLLRGFAVRARRRDRHHFAAVERQRDLAPLQAHRVLAEQAPPPALEGGNIGLGLDRDALQIL